MKLQYFCQRYHYVGLDGTEFSLALAEDEGWNYLVVPEDQVHIFTQYIQILGNLVKVNKFHPQDLAAISSLGEDSAILAPWDVCSLGDERVVNGVVDELAAVKEVRDT